jgi:uncharacterized membrane protein YozB (DUF420 family)
MIAYILLILAAITGFVCAPDDHWKLLLGGFIAYFTFVHMVVFGDARFHLPLIPLFALYAGWFLANRVQISWTRGRLGATSVLALVFVLVWLHEIAAAVEALTTRT